MSDRLVRLLLIAEDPIFRLGLQSWLGEQPGWQVVAEADSVAQAEQMLQLPAPEPGADAKGETLEPDATPAPASEAEQTSPAADSRGTPSAEDPALSSANANADVREADRPVTQPTAPPTPNLAQPASENVEVGRSAETEAISADLVLLDVGLGSLREATSLELQPPIASLPLCQRIKAQYPTLPVFFVASAQDMVLVEQVRAVGASGFCAREPAPRFLEALRQVAEGQPYWPDLPSPASANADVAINRSFFAPLSRDRAPSSADLVTGKQPVSGPLFQSRNRLRVAGQTSIQSVLAEINQQLQIPNLSLLEREILKGRRRELQVAGWMVNQLLIFPWERSQNLANSTQTVPLTPLNQSRQQSSRGEVAIAGKSRPTSNSLRATIFDHTLEKLQAGLVNLTSGPLEVDILQEGQKRELLYIILRKFEDGIDDLQHSQVQLQHLSEKRQSFLQDLWQASIEDFFGKYYTLTLENRTLEVVPALLEERAVVEQAILNRIPQVEALLAHLLFQTPLIVDSRPSPAGSPAATYRAEVLLHNLMIRVANGIIQPLLNRFAHVPDIKQTFYHRRLLSTREIERFRNDLSWKYRLRQYLSEPREIFESQFSLLVFAGRGIQQIRIYAPRDRELEDLTGLQRLVTLSLETRDAVAPRLRSVVSLVGSGLVYLLTQVVGRSIGLIGRGILQSVNAKPKQKQERPGPMRD